MWRSGAVPHWAALRSLACLHPPPGPPSLAAPASQMDAAGSLILLSILILLAKDPTAVVRVGHPLFVALAANLSLPLLALAPGPLRNW